MHAPARPGPRGRSELRHALHYVRDHLSLYQLTIEPGTRFFTLREAAGSLYWTMTSRQSCGS